MPNVPKLYSEVIPQGDLVEYCQRQKYRNSMASLLHGVNPWNSIWAKVSQLYRDVIPRGYV